MACTDQARSPLFFDSRSAARFWRAMRDGASSKSQRRGGDDGGSLRSVGFGASRPSALRCAEVDFGKAAAGEEFPGAGLGVRGRDARPGILGGTQGRRFSTLLLVGWFPFEAKFLEDQSDALIWPQAPRANGLTRSWWLCIGPTQRSAPRN